MMWEMWSIGIMPCILSADQTSYIAHATLRRVDELNCVLFPLLTHKQNKAYQSAPFKVTRTEIPHEQPR